MKTKEWLKKIRNRLGLTKQEFADEIGVSFDLIKSIESGKRKGSDETWEKIIKYLKEQKLNSSIKFSFDSEDLIEELKEDIEEFGPDEECYLFYKLDNDFGLLFTNYDFEVLPEELDKDEEILKTTLNYALKLFEIQNEIL